MDPPSDPPTRKFQTRRGVQRTSKADREAFARSEERRQAEAQREVERAAVAAARGTYTPRGRGTLQGTSAERTRNENSGGVFGAAVPALGAGTGRGRGAGRVRGRGPNADGLVGVKEEVLVGGVAGGEAERIVLDGDAERPKAGAGTAKAGIADGAKKTPKSRAKPATERKKTAQATKKDGPIVLSSDEEGLAEEGPRWDIETIEISSDEAEGDGAVVGDDDEGPLSSTGKAHRRENRTRAPKAKMALRPVRAARETHEMDELGGFSNRRKIQRSVRDKDKAYGGEDAIGGLPADDDYMELDEAGPSTDFSLKGLESQTKSSRKKALSAKDKDPKVATETIEERAERLRYAEDVRKLRHELSARPPVMPPTGDVDMAGPDRLDRETESGRDGKIYLFQFPPLTPMLVDPAHKDDVVEIKQEPGAESSKPEVGTSASTAAQSSNKGKEKEKEKPPHMKKEDHDSKEDTKAQIAAAVERAKILTADGARLPPGFAGKLNVHKSGKVTLEWGETNMEVRWGSEVDFLQDAVLAAGDEGEGVKLGEERSAFALGQVQKKLVVTPDWQKIYE